MDNNIEKFYVYRTLNVDNTWGAIVLDSNLYSLPNISFGMRIFATNEKEAITKAKTVYDKIHAYDSDKENVRRFTSSILKSLTANMSDINDSQMEDIAAKSVRFAVKVNNKYDEYFRGLEDDKP